MNDIYYIIESTLSKKIDNESVINLYYEIGSILKRQKLSIKTVALNLKYKYGIVIAFTERNLNNMVKFSSYDKSQLSKLSKITWKNILIIMKNDSSLIDICINYNPTKQELMDYIKRNKELVKNKNIELDDTLEELIKLQVERRIL